MPSYLYLGSNPVVLGGFSNTGTSTTPWVRPTDWLALPNTGSSGGFVGLTAVYSSSVNYIALSAQGDYTINWGDGYTANYSSSQIAYYSHSFNSLSSASWSSGSDGYGHSASLGYRQAIVILTPSGSSTLTNINLHRKHFKLAASTPAVNWLDIAIGGPDLTSLSIAGNSIRMSLLERANITNIPNSASFTQINTWFQYCTALQDVRLFDTANVYNFASLYFDCRSLVSPPLLNTSKGTNFAQMHMGNYSLLNLPNYNMQSASQVNSFVNGCGRLESVPAFNFTTASTVSGMFQGCTRLTTVPYFDTSLVTDFSSMFNACYGLKYVPSFSSSKSTLFNGMFQNCYSLQEAPMLDLSSGSNLNSMFLGCNCLSSVPNYNTSRCTNFLSMFNACYALQSIPLLDASYWTASGLFTTMFSSCYSLKSGALTGSRSTLNYSSCSLETNELYNIFNYLAPTGSTPCSITCSGNPGSANLSDAIITSSVLNKGWTILK